MALKDWYEMDKRAKPEETTVDWWNQQYRDMMDGMLYGRSQGTTIKAGPAALGPGSIKSFFIDDKPPQTKDRVDQLTEAVAELTKIVVRLNKRIDDLENSR